MKKLSENSIAIIILVVIAFVLLCIELRAWYVRSSRDKKVLKNNKMQINQELDQTILEKFRYCSSQSNRHQKVMTALMDYIINQFRDLKGLTPELEKPFKSLRKHIVTFRAKTVIAGFHEELKKEYVDDISVEEYKAFNVLMKAGATRGNMIREFAGCIAVDALEKHFSSLYEDIMSATFKDTESRDYAILVFYRIYMSFERCKMIIDKILEELHCDKITLKRALDSSAIRR